MQSRALFTRVICLNPRYGVSLIGREAFSANLEEATARASEDVMIYDQKACTSSLVHYVEGSPEQAGEYAQTLGKELAGWDGKIPASYRHLRPAGQATEARQIRRR